MFASSRMWQDVDEATSESSWTALAKVWRGERDCWSIDLEGDVEKLEVSGLWFGTTGDSVEPKRGDGPQVRTRKGHKRRKGKAEGR